MFVCGPTVYDESHVGHARTYLAYDIIARYLRTKGYNVFYLMNITDIDDKIITRANAIGEKPLQLADGFAKEFLRDMQALRITSVNLYAKASEHMVEIIDQVKTLVEKGYAYDVDGDIFFDVSKSPNYGELSGQNTEQLVMHRIDPDPRKRSVVDFALWKKQKPGEPAWDSPWGKGRPGWHIEDTAITTTYFGPQYDLHGGGLDLIFPHHEAEIALGEAATGVKPLVKYWLHGGLVTVKGARMGKSVGNFTTIKETLRRHDPEVLRLYYAMSHYRSPLEFDESNVAQAEQVLNKLRSVYSEFKRLLRASEKEDNRPVDEQVHKLTSEASKAFIEAMDYDFNTPRALATLIAFARDAEPLGSRQIGKRSISLIVQTFDYFGSIFGILQSAGTQQSSVIDGLVETILELRNEARKKGDWESSDRIRSRLARLGIVLEDTPTETRWYATSPNNQSG
jgi:cysteinyl-tRNA synthetase